MAEMASSSEVAEAMFKLVKGSAGVKKFKAMDLEKAMREVFGERVDKAISKAAIKELIDSGRCVYTYFGGSFIEVPHTEAAANPQN